MGEAQSAESAAGTAVIMADGSAALTRAELEHRSRRLAAFLRGRGLQAGDRVAVLLENTPEWFVVLWAVRRAGLLAVPLNWHLRRDEVRYVLQDSDSRALVASDVLLELASEASEGVAAIEVRLTTGRTGAGFTALSEAEASAPPSPPGEEMDGGIMLYSSGTSGKPKGIVRPRPAPTPFGQPNATETLLKAFYGLDAATVYLCPAPIYHAAPIAWTGAVLIAGGSVVLMPSFDAEAALAAVARHRITHAQFVPTHFVRMLKLPEAARRAHDLSSLTRVVHAAAPCPPDVKRAMIDWLGPIVHEYYSGSEGAGFTALDTPQWLAHPGSVGRSLGGPIHIVDPETREELPAGREGLVVFEMTAPFSYHKDAAKTAEAVDARGWGALGDVGRLDTEGYLYLSDRLSHMIISGGVNIYPQEIENLLSGHPAVGDVAVIGVPDPDLGEAVKAVVEPAAGATPGPELAAELVAWCRERLSAFKRPRTVDFVDALPRHPNGKLLKRELRDRYAAPTPPPTTPPTPFPAPAA